MWLIETESFKLEYFVGDNIPQYAILSHTWGDGEVTFQDWQDFRKASKKTGFTKIKSACAQALADGLNYVWVDTNCIDKSSSAELSEAINSMFAWYKNSEICYVYLADVEDPDNIAGKLGNKTEELGWDDYFGRRNPVENVKKTRFIDSLRNSRWFRRGWTLQELLAPHVIRFLTQDWEPISMASRQDARYNINREEFKGGREQGPLLELLSDITGIQLDALTSPEYAMSCSVGEKMSWMAGRNTTREEDIAYCLLGIFDINMPLLYGEGIKAFERLQEEITKQSTDHSLFAWQWPQDSIRMKRRQSNLFADSPQLFSNFGNKRLGYGHQFREGVYEGEDNDPLDTILSLSNFGLSINLELIPTADPGLRIWSSQRCNDWVSEF